MPYQYHDMSQAQEEPGVSCSELQWGAICKKNNCQVVNAPKWSRYEIPFIWLPLEGRLFLVFDFGKQTSL